MNQNKILLRNIPLHIDKETVDLLFTNSRYGDNIKISNITINQEANNNFNYAIIEYVKAEVAKIVVAYGAVFYKNVKFLPILCPEGETKLTTNNQFDAYKFKLIISINEIENDDCINDETLRLYIEVLLGHDNFTYQSINYDLNDELSVIKDTNEYLIDSVEPIDFDKLLLKHKKKPKLRSQDINIEKIKQNGCFSIMNNQDQDYTSCYFDMQNFGIKALRTLDSLGVHLIEFKDKNTSNKVLKMKHPDDFKIKFFHDDINYLETKLTLRSKIKIFKRMENLSESAASTDNSCKLKLYTTEQPYMLISKSYLYIEKLKYFLSKYDASLIIKSDFIQINYCVRKISAKDLSSYLSELNKEFGLCENNMGYSKENIMERYFGGGYNANSGSVKNSIQIKYKECVITEPMGNFLHQCKKYVEDWLKNKLIDCEIRVNFETNTVKLSYHSADESHLDLARRSINDNFIEFEHCLSRESVSLLRDHSYNEFIDSIRNELDSLGKSNRVTFFESPRNHKVYCVGEKELVSDISTRIKQYFDDNTIFTRFYENISAEDYYYLKLIKEDDILSICRNVIFECENKRLRITGSDKEHEELNNELAYMLKNKICKHYEISDISVIDVFNSDKGKESLNLYEKLTKCMIINKGIVDSMDMIYDDLDVIEINMEEQNDNKNIIFSDIFLNVKIAALNDKLTNIKYADAIVVASNSDLTPFDQASGIFLNRAGDMVKDELKAAVANCMMEQFFEGENYISDAGALKCCKVLVHAVVPKNIIEPAELFILKNGIKDIFSRLNQMSNSINSIAIPLFYTEMFDANVMNSVVNSILSAIFEYLNDTPEQENIKEIYIVDNTNSGSVAADLLKSYGSKYKTQNTKIKQQESICSAAQKISFLLISDHEAKIEEAINKIKQILYEEKKTHILRHNYVQTLNEDQMHEINERCKVYQVSAEFDRCLGSIKLFGKVDAVNKCISVINERINNYIINGISSAHKLCKEIQWEYSRDNQEWNTYNIFLIGQIESAYQNKMPLLEINDDFDEKCLIDFNRGIQTNSKTGRTMCYIRRTDMKKKFDIQLPLLWEVDRTEDLILLDPDLEEYKNVLFELVTRKLKKKKILSIHRVQNLRLYIQYQAHKSHFEARDRYNVNERTLFHGTTGDSVEKIWKSGFNRSYAGKNATAHGKGVYFARDPAYSHEYTNLGTVGIQTATTMTNSGHLFMCKVLVGYYAVGKSSTETKNLPTVPEKNIPVDSTVNNVLDPSIFVIYHDAQAYPEYLITYQ